MQIKSGINHLEKDFFTIYPGSSRGLFWYENHVKYHSFILPYSVVRRDYQDVEGLSVFTSIIFQFELFLRLSKKLAKMLFKIRSKNTTSTRQRR